jgi:threonine/homoserine/homoserine lactone efflux protein
MLDSQVLAFVGVVTLLTITPGADTMLVMRSVLARGQGAGLITMLGICTGLFVHATLSALGLSLILVRSATAFKVVQLAGAGYLVFLGLQAIMQARRRHQRTISSRQAQQHPVVAKNRRRSFFEGLLTNTLNPKVAIFYLAFLPQFIGPTDPVLAKSMLLAGIHFVLGIIWLSTVVFLVGRVVQLFSQSTFQSRLEQVTGAVLIALGVRLVLERR